MKREEPDGQIQEEKWEMERLGRERGDIPEYR
jgi:hypothetical protein